jgi:hypothetical protein
VMTLGDVPVLVHRTPRPVGAGGDQASAG